MNLWLVVFTLLGSVNLLSEVSEQCITNCIEEIKTYSLTESTPFGFSGADIANLTADIKELEINYCYKPAKTRAAITFDIAPWVRYIHNEAIYGDCPSDSWRIICPQDYIQLTANITLTSEDGAFKENWITMLESDYWNYDPSIGPKVSFVVALDELNGNFNQDAPPEHRTLAGIITKDGFKGEVYHLVGEINEEGWNPIFPIDATLEECAVANSL